MRLIHRPLVFALLAERNLLVCDLRLKQSPGLPPASLRGGGLWAPGPPPRSRAGEPGD